MDGPVIPPSALYWLIAPHSTTRPPPGQPRQHGVEHLSPDVVEVDVDAVGGLPAQPPGQVRGLVVQAGVEPQLVHHGAAFALTAGDAHHPAALEPGDLPGDAARRPGGPGHHDGLALAWLPDVQQPEVRGQSGHPQRAQVGGQRRTVAVDHPRPLAVAHRVLLHAGRRRDVRPLREVVVTAGHHLADHAGAHHLTEPDRRDVRTALVHPAAHRGVERDVAGAQQELPVAGLGCRLGDDVPHVVAGQALRAPGQPYLGVVGHGPTLPLPHDRTCGAPGGACLTASVPLSGEYVPSSARWVREQVERYEASGGTEATTLRETGLPVVIVTNRGVRSGSLRKTPLMRVEHEGRYAAIASQGGAPRHPSWYANLVAEPHVELQDGPSRQDMRAREVHGAEREQWWERAVAAFPPYADYQERTERRIPVLVLEPRQPD